MKVRTNAETPADARMARSFGAEGIGLCRTEHMFFEGDRIVAMREMILADTEKDRRAALAKLLPMQRSDFVELFEIMAGLPVTIRLLDPPLHEFLPKTEEEIAEVAAAHGRRRRQAAPAHRGAARVQPDARPSRLPARHLLSGDRRDAGARHLRGGGRGRRRRPAAPVVPEIMVPLVGLKTELDFVKARIDAVAQERDGRRPASTIDYLVGTMIELPRAAIRAHVIAESGRVLLLRHQRPDPDDLRHLARRRRRPSWRPIARRASSSRTRSSRSTSTASANWCAWRPRRAGRRGPTSSSASAASMAATRPRSASARRSGSTMCPARPSACRSPGWRRRRRRSGEGVTMEVYPICNWVHRRSGTFF